MYEEKIKLKEEEIEKYNKLKGRDLFNIFSLEEKINNIRLNNKTKKLVSQQSTNENSL